MRTRFKPSGISRRLTRGAVGGGILMVLCCWLLPLAVGLAGLLATGLEVATVVVVAAAAAILLLERPGCGSTCRAGICRGRSRT